MNRGDRLGTVERNVIDAVQAVDNPLEVTPFAKTNGWEVGWVSQIITDAEMPGELRPQDLHGSTALCCQRVLCYQWLCHFSLLQITGCVALPNESLYDR